jgi:hypothetical protein
MLYWILKRCLTICSLIDVDYSQIQGIGAFQSVNHQSMARFAVHETLPAVSAVLTEPLDTSEAVLTASCVLALVTQVVRTVAPVSVPLKEYV